MIDEEAMNSVTEKKSSGRPSILTKDVMAGIPVLVQQGLTAEAIAATRPTFAVTPGAEGCVFALGSR